MLLYKNGYRSFPKPIYKKYKKELAVGMKDLKPIKGAVPIKCIMKFHVKDGADREKWRVKMLTTGNTSKLCKTEVEAEDYHDCEKHEIEKVPLEIRYGAVGDTDNIQKPITDLLEELGYIDNDRYIVEMIVEKTFGNKEETIEIELEELEVVNGDNISFRRRELYD